MPKDPDLVITSVDPSLRHIGKHELRKKLVSFLAVSLPPVPLKYATFEAHIKAQCETYYDSVIKEVFESLAVQWNRRFTRSGNVDVSSDTQSPTNEATITISSDDESEAEESELEKHVSSDHETEHVEQNASKLSSAPATETTGEIGIPSPKSSTSKGSCEEETPRALSDGELIAFKAEKSTKKYTRYLQETYDLIKNIERTTSCSICSKLKRRIQKFVSLVGQESAIIQHKLAKELMAHRISPKGNLTDAALEKMRMGLLIDKLIEISLPDILKGAELMETNVDCGEEEHSSAENTGTKKKREKRKSNTDSADVLQVEASCSTEPSSNGTKNKRAKKTSSVSCDAELSSSISKSSSQPSNKSCSENEEKEPRTKMGKKKTEKSLNQTREAPRSKPRKISIKVKDTSHPDLT